MCFIIHSHIHSYKSWLVFVFFSPTDRSAERRPARSHRRRRSDNAGQEIGQCCKSEANKTNNRPTLRPSHSYHCCRQRQRFSTVHLIHSFVAIMCWTDCNLRIGLPRLPPLDLHTQTNSYTRQHDVLMLRRTGIADVSGVLSLLCRYMYTTLYPAGNQTDGAESGLSWNDPVVLWQNILKVLN